MNQRGQALIEYCLIISLIALVALVALRTTGTHPGRILHRISSDL